MPPISGLNILLSSHVWRQDHNGFSHQDPGFIDLLLNKANDTHIVNAYYPADANMALAVAERVYQSTDCVNAIFCGKQPAPHLPDGRRGQVRARRGRSDLGVGIDCRFARRGRRRGRHVR